MITRRQQLISLIQQGAIPPQRIRDALAVTGVLPDAASWRRFIDRLLLWLGCLALCAAVVFFIAYNWQAMGRFSKFALVEVPIVLAIIGYWRIGSDTMAGKLALLLASILVGVLLALYGQTYQTGADSWQLFFTWSCLLLPWLLIGRFAALWILWVSLINLSIILYYQSITGVFWLAADSAAHMLWPLFIFNSLALAVWEFLATRWQWLAQRWTVRLLALAGGYTLTWLVLLAVFDGKTTGYLAIPIWLAWLAVLYWVYQRYVRDLFMLAGGCLSGIIAIVAFLLKFLGNDDVATFFILALAVIGLGSGAAVWLRQVHRGWLQ